MEREHLVKCHSRVPRKEHYEILWKHMCKRKMQGGIMGGAYARKAQGRYL